MRSPHLDRASPDRVNIVRDGQHGQRLVGVEVQIIHGTSMAEVAQDQVLLRALLRLTASQQPHRQDVEQVDLPRFRARGARGQKSMHITAESTSSVMTGAGSTRHRRAAAALPSASKGRLRSHTSTFLSAPPVSM